MRAQFAATITDICEYNERVILLYGDVGGYAFRNVKRAINCGISEQAMVSMAGGLAKAGMIPVVYTIAPFLAERALEQIKVNAYNNLPVIYVTVGASYDYATMGATHHCPADIPTLYNVPSLGLLCPGAPGEVDAMLKQAIDSGQSYYMRLSVERNGYDYSDTVIGKAIVNKKGCAEIGIIAVGNTLAQVSQAVRDLPEITVVYLPTVRPLDMDTIRATCAGLKVVLVEPFYSTLSRDIAECGVGRIINLSPRREFVHHYGTLRQMDKTAGIYYSDIRRAIWEISRPTTA
ncbi:MAG: hypothetical protein WC389_21255 [Lutibacter sp.]|jgi:transketolase